MRDYAQKPFEGGRVKKSGQAKKNNNIRDHCSAIYHVLHTIIIATWSPNKSAQTGKVIYMYVHRIIQVNS